MAKKVEKNSAVDNKDETENNFLTVLITAFSTVFLAELGDKTQVATLLLSAQSGRPTIVFLGAGLALICSSLVSVLLGRWLAKTLAPEKFEYLAGLLMIGIGLIIGIQASEGVLNTLQIN